MYEVTKSIYLSLRNLFPISHAKGNAYKFEMKNLWISYTRMDWLYLCHWREMKANTMSRFFSTLETTHQSIVWNPSYMRKDNVASKQIIRIDIKMRFENYNNQWDACNAFTISNWNND